MPTKVDDPDPDGSVNVSMGWFRFRTGIPNVQIRIQLLKIHYNFYKIKHYLWKHF
jgi:hypothetical protein